MFQLALSGSFEYLCHGTIVSMNFSILAVRGPSLDVRISRLQSSDSDGPRTERLTHGDRFSRV